MQEEYENKIEEYENTFSKQSTTTDKFESIKEFTKENIIESISTIKHTSLFNHVQDVITNFINQFVSVIKEYIVVTDISRKVVMIKTSDNNYNKLHVEKVILDCLTISKKELVKLLKNFDTFLKREQEDELDPKDFVLHLEKLCELKVLLFENKSNDLVKKISLSMVKNSDKI